MPSCRTVLGACAISRVLCASWQWDVPRGPQQCQWRSWLDILKLPPSSLQLSLSSPLMMAWAQKRDSKKALKHRSTLQGCHECAKASGKTRPRTHLAAH